MKNEFAGRAIAKLGLLGLVCGLTASCGVLSRPDFLKPKTDSDAHVYVAAYPVIPWESIRDSLQPKHGMTIEQACTLAARTSQIQTSQLLSMFAAGLGIGLPGRQDSVTETLAADGTRTTTGTSTRSTGAVPASSGAGDTAVSESTLSIDPSKAPASVALDASTLLTTCTSIYQQAQLLENQLTKLQLPKGYRAHLLTLQINLQPQARDLALDAYTNVTILPADWGEAVRASEALSKGTNSTPPVIVYPLLVSDTIESSSASQIAEQIRQAALQLGGVISQVGVQLGLKKSDARLDSLIGLDKNSVVTVGRVSDHTIRIRLGAQYAGSNKLMTVPRSHNVSLVVLSRWGDANTGDANTSVTNLSAVTETEFVRADGSGRRIESPRSRSTLAELVSKKVENFEYANDFNCACGRPSAEDKKSDNDKKSDENICLSASGDLDKEPYLQLLRSADRADYRTVSTCLRLGVTQPAGNSENAGLAVHQITKLRRFLADLMAVQSDTRHSTLTIALPPALPGPPQLPDDNQLAIATDDEKSALSIVLRGAKNLTAGGLKAELRLKAPSNRRLLPTSVQVVGTGEEVKLSFPSLKQLKLDKSKLKDEALVLKTGEKLDISAEYELVFVESQEKPASNPLSVTQPVVVADASGFGRLTVQVGEIAADQKVFLKISGADARQETSPGTLVVMPAAGLEVKSKSVVTLTLSNLSSARPVVISATQGGNALGSPLTVVVERLPYVPKS